MKKALKFNEDGSLKILQFTDMHLGDGDEQVQALNDRTMALVQTILDAEKPDFVVFTGDLIWGNLCADPIATYRRAIAPVANAGIPWASVFGNHDAEGSASREDLLAVQQEYDHCLSEAGPSDIHGVGNYVLKVKNAAGDQDRAVFYFLDTGINAPAPVGGWGWLYTDQINWYTEQSKRITEEHGGVLPSLAFYHIPVPEYVDARHADDVTGMQEEPNHCPLVNTGFFGAMIQMGDVMGSFVGHDHDNSYSGTVHGIRLCYGRVTGYNTYGKLPRGARVIKLQEGKREFETYIIQDDGQIIV